MGVSNYGMMSSLVSDSTSIKQKLDQLTNQASSGYVSSTYAGLGTGAPVSLDLTPQIASLQTYQNNIDAASGSMQVTQTVMTQIQSIASNLASQLDSLNTVGSSGIDTISAQARSALQQVGSLLDTQDGGAYVFAGQDSSNPPVPDPANITSTGFYTDIATAVAGLATNGATATIAATLASAQTDAATPGASPFSAFMATVAANGTVSYNAQGAYQAAVTALNATTPGTPAATAAATAVTAAAAAAATASAAVQSAAPVTQIGQSSTVPTGLLASANFSASSTGTSTTGSYMIDLMRALATVGSLNSNQAGTADFTSLVQDTRTSLNGAVSAMATDAASLGDTQSKVTATQTQLGDVQTALTTQLSSAQDTNMAATLSSLSLVQTQLQASYQVIASLSGLSLAKYLPS
jgi:flagellar hook-associated protein 3 FlgL